MEQEIWSTDQPVLSDDLIQLQSSKEDAIKTRLTDIFTSGIEKSALNEFAITVNGIDNTKIDVDTGLAFDPSGERIAIENSSVLYVNAFTSGSLVTSGNPFAPDGTPNGPLTTSSDGLGGYTLTPQNSGCKQITLITGDVNYVFIAYLQTTDQTTFTLQDLTNKRLFTKAQDGYKIEIVGSATIVDPATLNPDPARFIFLGYADFRLGNPLTPGNISSSGRTYFSLNNLRHLVSTTNVGKTNRTLTYNSDQLVSLDNHVKAVGSGNVSNTNPHGLTAADLNLSGKTVEQHEKTLHSSGITGTDTSQLNGLVNNVSGAALPPTFGIDTFRVSALTSQFLEVFGVTIDSTSDLGSQNEVFFNDAAGVQLSNGSYTIYVDSLTKTVQLASTVSIGQNYRVNVGSTAVVRQVHNATVLTLATNFSLWSLTFTYGLNILNFSNVVDLRIFGNVDSKILAHDSATDTVTLNHNVNISGDTEIDDTLSVATSLTVTNPSSGSNALVVRDSTNSTNQFRALENGNIDFTGLILSSQFFFGHIEVGPAASASADFTITPANFKDLTGTVAVAGTVFRVVIAVSVRTEMGSSGTGAGGALSQTVLPGSPAPGTTLFTGVYLNPPNNSKITFHVDAKGTGNSEAFGAWTIIAFK